MNKLLYVETFDKEGNVTSSVTYNTETENENVLYSNEKEFGKAIRSTTTVMEEREEEMKPEEIKPEIFTLHNNDDLKKITFNALLKVSDTIQNRCSPEEMPELVVSLLSLIERLEVFR